MLLLVFGFDGGAGYTIEDHAIETAEMLGDDARVVVNCFDSLDYKHVAIAADGGHLVGFTFMGADGLIYYMQAYAYDTDDMEIFAMIIASLVED